HYKFIVTPVGHMVTVSASGQKNDRTCNCASLREKWYRAFLRRPRSWQ
ncbi:hypothetical protein CUMW_159800, partial [Citrus unshiu]